MREQTSGLGQPVTKRRTLAPGVGNYYQQPQFVPANPHRAGHYAGLHPDDQPLVEEDESYYVTRPHTSVRRYTDTPTRITQGNTRYNVTYGAPPMRQRTNTEDEEDRAVKRGLRFHWLVYVGFVLFIGILGWIGLTALGQWWQWQQDNWTYGNPRTYQTDAVVGHNDSNSSPSHFTAENLRGQIIVLELPGGDAAKGRSYTITSMPGNTGNPPVKVMFQDLNHDGKLDMLVEIGDTGSVFTVFLFNNGQQFVSKL